MHPLLRSLMLCLVGVSVAAADPLPERLGETGLFKPGSAEIADGLLAFSPQYPLWSDGARKRRWLYLPPGQTIDAGNPDAWLFPPGTRVWKEFGYGGPVETRYIERLGDGNWRFATYLWNEDGSEAVLAPEAGMAYHAVSDAPGGRYPIPSREDCLACHDGGAGPLLGLNALQLSPDRDPQAPHAEAPQPGQVDLRALHEKGLLRNLPTRLLEQPPRIAATTAIARAALGYMHGNCGVCHNDRGSLYDMDFSLLQSAIASEQSIARTMETIVARAADPVAPGVDTRLVPGDQAHSALLFRMRSRNLVTQMPPLGRRVPDAEAITLIEQWIEHDLPLEEEYQR